MRLTQRQQVAWATPRHRINLYDGAVRAGKTQVSWLDWLRFIRQGPPGPLLMVGKTERTLKANILDPMLDFLGARRMRIIQGTGEARICGRLVYLVGANDERAEQKIRGRTLVGAYGDEVTLWPESFYTMLMSRLSLPDASFIGTTNPDSPRHWLKVKWLDRIADLNAAHPLGLGLARHHFRLEDNTTLPAEFVASLKAEYVGLWYKRFVEGLWVLAEGAVYDFFDTDPAAGYVRSSHPAAGDIGAWWVAVDYGTSNPFVALLMGRDRDGVTWVLDEWRWDSQAKQRQLTDSEYAWALRWWLHRDERCPEETRVIAGEPSPVPDLVDDGHQVGRVKVDTFVIDPSAASFRVEIARHGLTAIEADNAVLDGIRTVARDLAAHRLILVNRCEHCDRPHGCPGTIDETAAYSWDPKKQAKGEDAPLKVDDHGPDAKRYGVMSGQFAGPGTTVAGW